jgi:hypothetical protein
MNVIKTASRPCFPFSATTSLLATVLLTALVAAPSAFAASATFGANKAFATDKFWIGERLATRQPGTSPPLGALAPLEN